MSNKLGRASNLNQYKYCTIAQFANAKAEKKQRRMEAYWLLFLFVVGSLLLAAPEVWKWARATKTAKAEILIEGSRSAIDPTSSGNPTRWALWVEAARVAKFKWESALPGSIEIRFSLIADADACGPKAIACADAIHKIIYVAKDGEGEDVDRSSVMMHEIGHLRGVPHIEGDGLMDVKYQGAIEEPTVNAIAIAKKGPSFTLLEIAPRP